jgi:hypothetical protein
MAKFNEILAARFNRALQKALQMKGGPPSAQLASEVMPVWNFFRGIEDRWLESWNLYAVGLAAIATAGINPALRLRNPKTSNVVGVIQRIHFHNRNAVGSDIVTLDFRRDNPAQLNSLATAASLDGRNAGQSVLEASFTIGTAATQVGTIGAFTAPVNSLDRDIIFSDDQELTLLPGSALTCISSTPNTSLEGAFWWRERSLEESELF